MWRPLRARVIRHPHTQPRNREHTAGEITILQINARPRVSEAMWIKFRWKNKDLLRDPRSSKRFKLKVNANFINTEEQPTLHADWQCYLELWWNCCQLNAKLSHPNLAELPFFLIPNEIICFCIHRAQSSGTKTSRVCSSSLSPILDRYPPIFLLPCWCSSLWEEHP